MSLRGKVQLIEWARELKGVSRSSLDRACGFGIGTISKMGKRDDVLSEENLDHVIATLGLEQVVGGEYRFVKDTYLTLLIKDFMRVYSNYNPILQLMEMYRGLQSTALLVNTLNMDEIDKPMQKYLKSYPLFSFLIINIPEPNLIVFARSNHGFLAGRELIEAELVNIGVNVCRIESRVLNNNASEAEVRDFVHTEALRAGKS